VKSWACCLCGLTTFTRTTSARFWIRQASPSAPAIMRQPVMKPINVPATARASFAFYNTKEEIDTLANAIEQVIEVLADV